MVSQPPSVSAVVAKGLRGHILNDLKKHQPLTAAELASRYGVSANAIRRHLKELEAEHLVEYGREQRGKGAPTFAYRLTATGDALFPKRYAEELTQVLTFLEQRGGRAEVRRFFTQRFQAEAQRLLGRLDGSTAQERVEAVVGLLREMGFMAEWSQVEGGVRIAEHNCAMQAVAERYPEICDAEAEFLRETLQADVRRDAHIPRGCNACEYAVGLAALPPVLLQTERGAA